MNQILSIADRWKSIAVIAASALAYGIIYSFSLPLVTLIMDNKGYPAFISGANAAMPALGILLTGPFIPLLAHRIGVLRSIILGVGLMVSCLIIFTLTENLYIWFVVRFITGVAAGIQWMISEIWINLIAQHSSRGRAIALYTTLLSIGFALGPQLLAYTGIHGSLPFYVGAVIIASSLLPLPLARKLVPDISKHNTSPLALIRSVQLLPVGLLAGIVSGVAETNILNFMPVYLQRLGFAETASILALSAFTAGSIVSQFPLGWVADRTNKTAVLVSCATASAVGCIAFPFMLGQATLFWVMLFIWGGIVVAFYTVGLSYCAQFTKTPDIAAMNAAFVMAYTIGMIVGPPLGGWAIDLWNPQGLLVLLAGIFSLYAIVPLLVRSLPFSKEN